MTAARVCVRVVSSYITAVMGLGSRKQHMCSMNSEYHYRAQPPHALYASSNLTERVRAQVIYSPFSQRLPFFLWNESS